MSRKSSIKSKVLAAVAAGVISFSTLQPAYAIFGVGDVVIDPSNLAQNVMTAARTLQMVNNQIKQLTNESQMLTSDARNLQSLDFSSLSRLRESLSTVKRLFEQAQGLAFDIADMEAKFERAYPKAYDAAVSSGQLKDDKLKQWSNAREAIKTAMKIQAQAVHNFSDDESVLSELVNRSDSAPGALAAQQAANQLIALQVRQLMQAQQLQVGQDRAVALEHARAVAEEERARELRRRFMTPAAAYRAAPVTSF